MINTYNRAASLATTLDALRHQTFTDFEVVVVDGPSDDGTAELLEARKDALRVVRFDERNLSVSRNLGIDAAAGEVVAFIDDDAIPEARWLADLAAAYDSPEIGGAGGLTLDNTGVKPQYRYSLCDRIGRTDFDARPPFGAANRPGADPFLYLQGTNCSFRRSALEAIEGFDEEIEYNYDEVEVCARVIDAGLRLRALDGAVVHHKFRPSHMRRKEGYTDPFFAIKNRAYFALRVGAGHRSRAETLASLLDDLHAAKAHIADAVRRGDFTRAEQEAFDERADAGMEMGIERGLAGVRRGRPLLPADPDAFRPYPVLVPERRRLSVCFASMDYPPRPLGGVGRYTHDLARGMAAAGHEAHVVTRDDEQPYRLDFEEGVWVHRFPVAERWAPALAGHPLKGLLDHQAAVRSAVQRAAQRTPFDVVTGSSWAAEPLLCALDATTPVNVVCVTPMRTIADAQPAIASSPLTTSQIAAEDALLRSGAPLQAISQEVAGLVSDVAGAAPEVVWLGTADHRGDFARRRAQGDDAVEILFVGRLERRKGVDVLLEAGARLLRERSQVRLRIAGADNAYANGAEDLWPAWVAEHASDVADRIVFDGPVDDTELLQAYADADIFCAPSRYESFGLVHVEAMMMGLPVIGGDVGGMRATIVDGETGLLVDPEDPSALLAALTRLVDDGALRARMGAAGRARYDAEFALTIAVERHVERFEALAGTVNGEGDLAETLQALCGLSAAEAEGTAEVLLDPIRFPADLEAGVRRALAQPTPAAMVDGLFRSLLDRPVDDASLAGFLAQIDGGADMVAIVTHIATSDEARGLGRDPAFLERLPRLDAARARREITELWLRDDDEAFRTGLSALLGGVEVPANGDRANTVRATLAAAGDRVVMGDTAWLDGLRTEGEIIAELRAAKGDALIAAAYRLILGRDPDPGAAGFRGQPRAEVVRAIAGSAEARERGMVALVAERLAAAVGDGRRPRVRPSLLARGDAGSDAALRSLHADLTDRMRTLQSASVVPPFSGPDASAPDAGLREEVASLVDADHAARSELAGLRQAIGELNDRLAVMHGKQEALALDVRQKLPDTDFADAPEPRIPDPDAFARRVETIGSLRLNLGCGEKPLDGYVNVDARALPGVDVVADIRRLPFEPGTVAEIASFHLVEHFRQHDVETVLLPYWRSLLAPGGRLRVVTPNWAALIEDLAEGRLSFPEFKKVTFGAQDYEGDDHFALYSPETMTAALRAGGFDGVEMVVERRQNGLSPEMEMLAAAPIRQAAAP